MRVILGTLCLNEMEWLPYLYEQHKDWPGLAKWVFVEAADKAYADANPDLVSHCGLSVDGTSIFLRELSKRDSRVVYVRHGFSGNLSPELGKIAARDRYLAYARFSHPDIVVALDADEFYTQEDQGKVNELLASLRYSPSWCVTLPRREIWRPPSAFGAETSDEGTVRVKWRLFDYEVVGGFWGIPCCHWWRWSHGMRYRDCHNTPQFIDGNSYNNNLLRLHDAFGRNEMKVDPRKIPQMIHLGFASSQRMRLAKNRYYEVRGEKADKQRRWYTESRAAWETWKPGDVLPRGAKVIPYEGPIPEVFRGYQTRQARAGE